VEGLERRVLVAIGLEDQFRRAEVLEPMRAEVAESGRVEESGGRRADEDLAAVAGGGDARRTMDIRADVALLGQQRRAGVETDANADWSGAQRLGGFARCRQRAGGGGKGDEEASPWVSTSTPPWRSKASRRRRRWVASASA
jgi:hypothetical protein